jgi:hypothetical protein
MVQKELRKLSQWFWKRFLKWYDGGVKNEITSKRIFLKLKCFSPLRILTFPLFERLLELLFFFLFFSFFFSIFFSLFFFYAPSLKNLEGFDDIWREKSLLQKLSFQMEWHEMAVMTVDILAVAAYSRMGLCMQI